MWRVSGARFFVVSTFDQPRQAVGVFFAAPDGRGFVFTPAATRAEADRKASLGGARSTIFAVVPRWSFPALIGAGVIFSCLNALLEEILFRGLLYDALRISYGLASTLLIQALAFGAVHASGFPSGVVGVILASIYGLMQGGLRVYAGGLGVCWVAHVCADATIFALLLRELQARPV